MIETLRGTFAGDDVIPDGLASRLAGEFYRAGPYPPLVLAAFAVSGEIRAMLPLRDAIQRVPYSEGCRDQHAFEAERRALILYVEAHDGQEPRHPHEWRVIGVHDRRVIPWAYRHTA